MIEYKVIPNEKAPEIAQFLLDNFYSEEPIGLALGLTVEEVSRWLPSYMSAIIPDSVSIMALEGDKLVGVLVGLVVDPADPKSSKKFVASYIDPLKEPITTQQSKFLGKIWSKNPYPPKVKTLSHQYLCVNKNYGGKGIGKMLIERMESRAKEVGKVELTQVDATSEFSYRAYNKQGYTTMLEQEYAAYVDDDEIRPFLPKKEQMGPHTHLRLLTKNL